MPAPTHTELPGRPDRTPAAQEIDTSYLETLLGYNARRVSLKVIELFTHRMAGYGLSPVDFSILSLITHNPGITSRQICAALNLLPPNLVGKINAMEKRKLLARLPHPDDGRAIGLYLTDAGQQMMVQAEKTATELEQDAASRLSSAEKKTLLKLLQKVYF
jgi:DNA-binding MarR family transcriptional regulator